MFSSLYFCECLHATDMNVYSMSVRTQETNYLLSFRSIYSMHKISACMWLSMTGLISHCVYWLQRMADRNIIWKSASNGEYEAKEKIEGYEWRLNDLERHIEEMVYSVCVCVDTESNLKQYVWVKLTEVVWRYRKTHKCWTWNNV